MLKDPVGGLNYFTLSCLQVQPLYVISPVLVAERNVVTEQPFHIFRSCAWSLSLDRVQSPAFQVYISNFWKLQYGNEFSRWVESLKFELAGEYSFTIV